MQRNLDISTLRALVTVIDMASVTKAANKLHLTQSTVSMQIKRLEETLDMTLLKREGRAMKATSEGDQLLRYARKLVAINDETVDRLTNHDHDGELRFGVPFDIADTYVPKILKRFISDYPQVKVSLTIDNTTVLLEEFDAGKLDLILTTEFEASSTGRWLLSRDLIWTGAIDGKAWARSPVPLAFTKNCIFRQTAIDALENAGIAWTEALSSNGHSFDSGTIACVADLGIRADIEGFLATGTEAIDDNGSRLPKLPRYHVNAYLADGPNADIANIFVRFIESAFAGEHSSEKTKRLAQAS